MTLMSCCLQQKKPLVYSSAKKDWTSDVSCCELTHTSDTLNKVIIQNKFLCQVTNKNIAIAQHYLANNLI